MKDFNHFDINDSLGLQEHILYDNRIDGDLFLEVPKPKKKFVNENKNFLLIQSHENIY